MPLTEEQMRKRDLEYLAEPEPENLWFAPRCESLEDHHRDMSDTPIHDCTEPDCGCKAIQYVRIDVAIAGGYKPQAEWHTSSARTHFVSD